jgi:hypothetical protein
VIDDFFMCGKIESTPIVDGIKAAMEMKLVMICDRVQEIMAENLFNSINCGGTCASCESCCA